MNTKNYSLGKIYKITSEETQNVYIGSTCKLLLCQRMNGHRGAYKLWLSGKSNAYVSSFEILKFSDAKITLIENCACSSIDELKKCERKWIEATCNVVNITIPNRSRTEWKQTNEEYKANQKEYKKERNCEKHVCKICCGKFSLDHKTRHEQTTKHLKHINP